MSEKLETCKKYIWIIAKMCKEDDGCTEDWDERRTEIHNKIIELYDCDPAKLHTICSSLDVWVAFPGIGENFTDGDEAKYGKRLYDILESDFFKNAGWGDVHMLHKKLSSMYFDDDNFNGWTPEISNL